MLTKEVTVMDDEPSLDPDDYMTTQECARALKLRQIVTVRKYIKEGLLKAYRVRREYLIPREDFKRFFKSLMVKPPAPKPPAPKAASAKGGALK